MCYVTPKERAQTSDRFQDLTQQYTALYGHLAEGARELCSTQVPALASGHDFPTLAASPNAGAAKAGHGLSASGTYAGDRAGGALA